MEARIPELDGIRGLAILLVLLWHYVFPVLPATPGSWTGWMRTCLLMAWSGVDLFFVLSGFLIGGILLDAKDSPSYFRTFYVRRIFRILPVYLVSTCVILSVLYGGWTSGPAAAFPVWAYLLFLQNLWMAWWETLGPEALGITWSLAVEEQFYLVLPLLIRRLQIPCITACVAAAILLAPCFRVGLLQFGHSFIAGYALLPCRADALGLGVLAALLLRKKPVWDWITAKRGHLILAFTTLSAGVVALHFPKYNLLIASLTYSWLALFYLALMLLAIVRPGRLSQAIFLNPALQRLGRISYAVYLFHQGIRGLAVLPFFGGAGGSSMQKAAAGAVSLVLTLLLAELSWKYFESPLIGRAHTICRY